MKTAHRYRGNDFAGLPCLDCGLSKEGPIHRVQRDVRSLKLEGVTDEEWAPMFDHQSGPSVEYITEAEHVHRSVGIFICSGCGSRLIARDGKWIEASR